MMDIPAFGANLSWIRINWTFLLFVGLIAGAFIFLRSTPSPVNTLTQLNGLLATGQPIIIEFYSNF
jgi:hypothetical protein